MALVSLLRTSSARVLGDEDECDDDGTLFAIKMNIINKPPTVIMLNV